MTNIKISDITLREIEQENAARLSFKEKVEIAKLLEKLQVDIIETGYIGTSPADSIFIKMLASTLEYSTLCVPVSLNKTNIDEAWASLQKAKKPRLNLIVPTSTVGMEYQYQIKAEKMLPLAGELTAHAVSLCDDIEFTAEDAVRSEPDFLASVLKAAIKAGAKTITLCDSVGEILPDELTQFIASVQKSVPELAGVTLSFHFRDTVGLASASALCAVKDGVKQLKVSSCTETVTLSLERLLNVFQTRGETLNISTGLNTTTLRRTCTGLAALTGGTESGRKVVSDKKASAPSDAALPDDADIDVLRSYIESIGYDISDDDTERIFAQYIDIARSKRVVADDIEALIAETAGQAPPTYQLKNYVINSGSAIAATAYVEFIKDGKINVALSAGDGPIDAAFRAAEQIFGTKYELEDFQIHAVTGGREATGDAIVKLRHDGKLYSGRGVSPDIVGAGIRAYLSAVNKIVYEG